jgi:hypothetical protein
VNHLYGSAAVRRVRSPRACGKDRSRCSRCGPPAHRTRCAGRQHRADHHLRSADRGEADRDRHSLVSEDHASEDEKDNPLVLTVSWSKTSHRRHRDVIAPQGSSRAEALPIRSDIRTKLVTAIARGRQWLSEIEAGAATVDGVAAREACSKRHRYVAPTLRFRRRAITVVFVFSRARALSVRMSSFVQSRRFTIFFAIFVSRRPHAHDPQADLGGTVSTRQNDLTPRFDRGRNASRICNVDRRQTACP